MSDIELRFVERDVREQVETYVAFVRKIQILQYRKGCGPWTDVPMAIEGEGQEK